MSNTVMADPLTYEAVLAGNVRAARARANLSQAACAERMKALGFAQVYGATIGAIERGERVLGAVEVAGLSLALQTTVAVLTTVPAEAGPFVVLPSGALLPSQRVSIEDNSVTWEGSVPKISQAAGEMPLTELRLADMRRELEAVERYVRDLRRQAAGDPEQRTEGDDHRL